MNDWDKDLEKLSASFLLEEDERSPLRRKFDTAVRVGKKALIATVLGAAALGSGYEWLEYEWPIKDGRSQGRVTEFAKEGLHTNVVVEFLTAPFCKTWEGQMAQENSTVEEDGTLSNTFRFSVQDDKVAEEISRAYDSRKKVSLEFMETSNHVDCFRKSNTLVTGVKVLEDEQAGTDSHIAPIMMQQGGSKTHQKVPGR